MNFRTLCVGRRLALGGSVVVLGLILQGVFALSLEKAALMEDRRIKTRHLVEAAHTVVLHYLKV